MGNEKRPLHPKNSRPKISHLLDGWETAVTLSQSCSQTSKSLYVIIKFMDSDSNHLKVDKTTIDISSLEDPTDETVYWSTKTPAERLAALEVMRQIIYGYDPTTTRLERVLTITERT